MIWAKEETYSRSEIEALQTERLRKQVSRAWELVGPYRDKMKAEGVTPGDIRNLSDISRLPFTTKRDFRETYPFGLFAVPRRELVRIHASSGTTGKATVVGYTQTDLDNWTETVSRIAVMGGASADDVAQICFGYGMFTGALGLHDGLTNIGAAVIPASAGNSAKQMTWMKDFGTTLIVATPSYAMHLAEMIKDLGVDPATDLTVRIGLFGGEGMSEALRTELTAAWGPGFKATQNYGMSELNGPGIAGECLELTGMHINEDHFYCEVIDPETGEVLPHGELGELVVTCLTKEAIPLLRYRTRDLTRLDAAPCACGRTTLRMENLSGRADDMLIIRGVNVFPSHIAEVLGDYPEIGPHYQITVSTENYLDKLSIQVELKDNSLLDSYGRLTDLTERIRGGLRSALGIDSVILLEAPGTLPRYEGKAKRIKDDRVN